MFLRMIIFQYRTNWNSKSRPCSPTYLASPQRPPARWTWRKWLHFGSGLWWRAAPQTDRWWFEQQNRHCCRGNAAFEIVCVWAKCARKLSLCALLMLLAVNSMRLSKVKTAFSINRFGLCEQYESHHTSYIAGLKPWKQAFHYEFCSV